MSRAAILPPESDRKHHRAVAAEVLGPPPSPPDLFRAAAEAVTQLAHTLRDCAREVEARGGQRVARGMLAMDRERAALSFRALMLSMPSGDARTEVATMVEGVWGGYVREAWSLRLLQMAAEAPARDTEPDSDHFPVADGGGP